MGPLLLFAQLAAPTLVAQDPVTAGVFERLAGSWIGTGTLLGRPATFEMEWGVVWNGRIATLRFQNAFVEENNTRTPVLEAVAYYRVVGDARGTWIDSRGEILTLSFEAGDSTLTVLWKAKSEKGRTEYVLASGDLLEVRDYVGTGTGWREFGQARYRRRDPSPTGPLRP